MVDVSPASSLFIPASADTLFGSTSADAIISATQSQGASGDQQTALNLTTAAKREINRIRGYKLELSLAEKQQLNEIQTEVLKIQEKVQSGTVRTDELEERTELLKEADIIIGKPTVDLEADETLAEFNNLRLAVLAPRLSDATQKRVDFMERFKDGLEKQIGENPERHSLQLRFQAVARQIDTLAPLRAASQLSRTDAKLYDDTVRLINDHAGIKVELTAAESSRVAALEETVAKYQDAFSQVSQPSSRSVANAYTSLVL